MGKQLNNERAYFIIICICTGLVQFGFAQNCFDSDFESGTVGGYVTHHGKVDEQGNLTFSVEELHPEQHKIMSIEDGFDPITQDFCLTNKEMPVVDLNAGRYSLRLGNSFGGARTSKVVLSFDVTSSTSFFLLKYAVVIEDPMHEHFEQPRFEMYIKDEQGDVLECGEYIVTAAADLDGFEQCGEWRVLPWTTAGFELSSYIGQAINIEIITTDCTLGGHGGYAYIDASCKPLELTLDGYCPDSASAMYIM